MDVGVPFQVESVPTMTVGQAMDVVADQCLSRGLQDTVQWLSELALSATPEVLAAELSASNPLQAVMHIDHGIHSPFPGSQFGGSGSPEEIRFLSEAWRYHRMGLSLFLSGEYMRCYSILLKAVRELGSGSPRESDGGVVPLGNPTAFCAKHASPRFSSPAGKPSPPARDRSEGAGELHESAHLGEDLLGASFKSTRVPSCVVFLCLYALYMDGQKYKHTNTPAAGAGDPLPRAANPHLRVLRALLLEALRNGGFCVGPAAALPHRLPASFSPLPSPERGGGGPARGALLARQDPYLTWLMGVVLRELGRRQEAATYLLASVCVNPLLWMAWQDLATLVSRESQLEELRGMLEALEPDFMVAIFLAHAKAALGVAPLWTYVAGANSPPPPPSNGATPLTGASPRRMLNTWQVLIQGKFPRSLYLRVQMAAYYCHQRKEMERAERVYEEIHAADPYRMDFIVDYSNVLFMKPDTLTLSSLAQKMYHADPFRAESNFVVGNYYVLLKRHERGVLHFRRATAIRPDFVAAWTLLGHAYVETKNTTAAIEAYRTVVALDERDYRGWYNLGQIYELLQAYHHALFYYWHATSLRPTDPRMWIAVSECLEHEGRLGESITCLERAEVYEPLNSDYYPNMVHTIGNYYIGCKNFFRACIYLEKLTQATKASEDDLRFVLPFLIQYYVVQAQQEVELLSRAFGYETAASSANAAAAPRSFPQHDRPDFSRVRPREPKAGARSASNLNLFSKLPPTGDDEASGAPRFARCLSYLSAAEAHIESFASLMRVFGTATGEGEGRTGPEALPFSPAPRTTAASKPPSVRKPRHGWGASRVKTNSPIVSTAGYTAASSTESSLPTTVEVHTHALGFLAHMRKEIAAIRARIQQRAPMAATASVPARPTGFF